ncbi:MAG: hypothetical protein IKZ51_00625 [Bacteroidales bacterium]|nr:hypothetical protein [Bacteroidales bacterium]
MLKVFRYFLTGVLFSAALSSCCMVDEDLSVCTTNTIDYQLRLVTNITTELETQLSLELDTEVRWMMEEYLKDIFTDYARDVDLSFYDRVAPMARLYHRKEQMNGSESSYSLILPARAYRHLAIANIAASKNVNLVADEECHTSSLVQHSDGNIVKPHTTGLFTARKDLDVMNGVDQRFDVRLYMANSASGLVLDMEEAPVIKDMRAVVTGFADEFNISDSTYVFNSSVDVETDLLETQDKGTRCYASVHFPSAEPVDSKVIIQVDSDQDVSKTPLWCWKVYVTLENDSVTESIVNVYTPLRAGHVKILRARVTKEGIVTTTDAHVGVSVTLDWSQGPEFPVDL